MSRGANRRGWRLGLFVLAAAASVAGGCGSGSSGFDEAKREGGAIDTAAGAGLCAPADGLVVCGSGATPAPADSPFAPGATILLDPASGAALPCAAEGAADGCSFEVRIAPSGFPPGTSFLGAYGLDEATSSWRGNDSPFVPMGDEWLSARFRLGGGTGIPAAAGTRIRVAALVYLPGRLVNPRLIAEEQGLLSSFEADLAFVATNLTVEPAGP